MEFRGQARLGSTAFMNGSPDRRAHLNRLHTRSFGVFQGVQFAEFPSYLNAELVEGGVRAGGRGESCLGDL